MKYTCMIVDDEDLGIDLLRHFIQAEEQLVLIGAFTSSQEALDCINSQKPDFIFTDIQMPELNGLDLLQQLTYQPAVVFVTAYSEYAPKAFELDVIDYLIKPYNRERFKKSIQKVEKYLAHKTVSSTDNSAQSIYVKHNGLLKAITVSDILFIEGMKQYVRIHTHSEKYMVLGGLTRMNEKLPAHFLRVHKSYIVNKEKIDKRNYGMIYVAGIQIPVSRGFKMD
jgi:two-component system, LytTR family, response regulator